MLEERIRENEEETDWLAEWTKDFLARRIESEGIKGRHKFYSHSPLRQLTQLVFTGFFKDTFYMRKEEVFMLSKTLHKSVAKTDSIFHLACVKLGRSEGLLKDQPLVGVLTRLIPSLNLRIEFDEYANLLATYPPSQLLPKFIDPIRKRVFGFGLGRYAKRLMCRVFQIWEESGKLPYYITKYREYLRVVLKLVHYPLPDQDYARVIFDRDLSNVSHEYLSAYLRFRKLIGSRRYVEACNIAREYKLPFSLIRSSIPKALWYKEEVYNAILETATSRDLVMFAKSFRSAEIPDDEIAKALNSVVPKSNVTSLEISKPMFMSHIYDVERGYSDHSIVTKTLANLFTNKLARVWREISTSFINFDKSSIGLVLDASGSMAPEEWFSYFHKCLIISSPLSSKIRRLVLFSDYANEHEPELLSSLDGLLELRRIAKRNYNGGTDIVEGLKIIKEYVDDGEIDTVILATDEQANINKEYYSVSDIIENMVNKGVKVIVHNPSPYPSHITRPISGITYTYGDRVESIIGSLRVQAMRDLKDEEVREIIVQTVEGVTKKAVMIT